MSSERQALQAGRFRSHRFLRIRQVQHVLEDKWLIRKAKTENDNNQRDDVAPLQPCNGCLKKLKNVYRRGAGEDTITKPCIRAVTNLGLVGYQYHLAQIQGATNTELAERGSDK